MADHPEDCVTAGGATGDSPGDQRFYCVAEGFLSGVRDHDGGVDEGLRRAGVDILRLHRTGPAGSGNLFRHGTADCQIIAVPRSAAGIYEGVIAGSVVPLAL